MNKSITYSLIGLVSLVITLHAQVNPAQSLAPVPVAARFKLGNTTTTDASSTVFVVPLDFQKGIQMPAVGRAPWDSSSQGLIQNYPWFTRVLTNTRYIYDPASVTATLAQPIHTIAVSNPVAAFGSATSAPPMYVGKMYRFAFYPGAQSVDTDLPDEMIIRVYNRSDFVDSRDNVEPTLTQRIDLPHWPTVAAVSSPSDASVPNGSNSAPTNVANIGDAGWKSYGDNGFQKTFITTVNSVDVLETTVQFVLATTTDQTWGARLQAPLLITHRSLPGAESYGFIMGAIGTALVKDTNGALMLGTERVTRHWMAVNDNGSNTSAWKSKAFNTGDYTLGYAMNFDPVQPWETTLLRVPSFQGQPAPASYLGKTAEEIHAGNAASRFHYDYALPPSNNSLNTVNTYPELRSHTILDNLVSSLNNDPVAIANYVHNEIGLTDTLSYNENGDVDERSINSGGLNRDALAVHQEGQGSPEEQCILLVYMLRKAGFNAGFVKPEHNSVQMGTQRISNLLKMRIKDAISPQGVRYSDAMISVNYAWVAAYLPSDPKLATSPKKWINFFPWLKDTQVKEGLSIEGNLPGGHKSIRSWVRAYLRDPSTPGSPLLSLDQENQTPANIFYKHFAQSIQTKGLNIDDFGVTFRDRTHLRDVWEKFPQPDKVKTTLEGANYAVRATLAVDEASPSATDTVYDTVTLQIIPPTPTVARSQNFVSAIPGRVSRGFGINLRTMDLHNRKVIINFIPARKSVFTFTPTVPPVQVLKPFQQFPYSTLLQSGQISLPSQYEYILHPPKPSVTSSFSQFLAQITPSNFISGQPLNLNVREPILYVKQQDEPSSYLRITIEPYDQDNSVDVNQQASTSSPYLVGGSDPGPYPGPIQYASANILSRNRQIYEMPVVDADKNFTFNVIYQRHRRYVPGSSLQTEVQNNGGWSHYLGIQNLQFGIDRQNGNAASEPITSTFGRGDMVAFCMNAGKVTSRMVETHIRQYEKLQNDRGVGGAVAEVLSGEDFDNLQSGVLFLQGMSYYQRVADSSEKLQNLFKTNLISMRAHGFSLLGASKDSSGAPKLENYSLGIDSSGNRVIVERFKQNQPIVDMNFMRSAWAGYGDLRADAGGQAQMTSVDYLTNLFITEASALEHETIRDFYKNQNVDAISTVDALHRTQRDHAAVVTTDMGTGNDCLLRFKAVQPGPAGNSIRIHFSFADLGLDASPTLSVVGERVNIVLNSRPGSESSIGQIVQKINTSPQVNTKIVAYIVNGLGSFVLESNTNIPAQLNLIGGSLRTAIQELDSTNWIQKGEEVFTDPKGVTKKLKDWCGVGMWAAVESAFRYRSSSNQTLERADQDLVRIYLTPGAVSGANGEWNGMGAMIYGRSSAGALIGSLSGGVGSKTSSLLNSFVPKLTGRGMEFSSVSTSLTPSNYVQRNPTYIVTQTVETKIISWTGSVSHERLDTRSRAYPTYATSGGFNDAYVSSLRSFIGYTTVPPFSMTTTTSQSFIPSISQGTRNLPLVNQLINSANLAASLPVFNSAPQSIARLNTSALSISNDFRNSVPTPRNNAGASSPFTSQIGSNKIADPVNLITGQFYVDSVDIVLPGKMPLAWRRNYVGDPGVVGSFGYSWRPAYFPSLYPSDPRPATDPSPTDGLPAKFLASELDGTTIAYSFRKDSSVSPARYSWVVDRAENPFISNGREQNIGSVHNYFRNRIELTESSGVKTFRLYGADGSIRTFIQRSFPVVNTPSQTRERPYLSRWADAAGNCLDFYFYDVQGSAPLRKPWHIDDVQSSEYGQLARIESSSGTNLSLFYNPAGKITKIRTGDGRVVDYSYDDFGDLSRVDLPDGSWTQYKYVHESTKYEPTDTSADPLKIYFSTHLIAQEIKPGGRILQNEYQKYAFGEYDETNTIIASGTANAYKVGLTSHKGRVIKQYSTVGRHGPVTLPSDKDSPASESGELTLNGQFEYNQIESGVGWITGYTTVKDAYDRKSVFYYTNNRITAKDDPLTVVTGSPPPPGAADTRPVVNRVLIQDWFTDADVANNVIGAWAGALKAVQERGKPKLEFYYYSTGDLREVKTIGELNGIPNTLNSDSASNFVAYNSLGLPVLVVSPRATDGQAVTNSNGTTLATIIPLGAYDTFYYEDTANPYLLTKKMSHAPGGTVISRTEVNFTSIFSVNGESSATTAPTIPFAKGLESEIKVFANNTETQAMSHGLISYVRPDGSVDARGFPAKRTAKSLQTDLSKFPDAVTEFEYNDRGEMVEERVMDGATAKKITKYAFDDVGRPIWTENLDSNRQQVAWNYLYYNHNGEPEWTDGSRSNPEDFTYIRYDAAGRAVESVAWLSRAKLDGSGVEAVPGANKYSTVKNGYNLFGNLIKVMDGKGNTTRAFYDGADRPIKTETWTGDWQSGGKNALGESSAKLSALETAYRDVGAELTSAAAYSNNSTISVGANGSKTQTFFTSAGQPWKQINPDGTSLFWTYFLDGRPKTAPLSQQTYIEFSYDDASRTVSRVTKNLAGVVLAQPQVETSDALGRVIESVSMLGLRSRSSYDGLGRTIRHAAPVDANGNAVAIGSVQPMSMNYSYDAAGLMKTETNALGETTTTTSDAVGRPKLIETKSSGSGPVLSRVSYDYDADFNGVTTSVGTTPETTLVGKTWTSTIGQLVLSKQSIGRPDESFTWTEFDVTGNAVASRSQTGQISRSAYDALGRTTSSVLADGAVTSFAYLYQPYVFNSSSGVVTGGGMRTKRIMPGGLKSVSVVDAQDRPVESFLLGADSPESHANLSGTQISPSKIKRWVRGFQYFSSSQINAANGEAPGLLSSFTDARGQTTTFRYDSFLRITQAQIGAGSSQITRGYDYIYNPTGLLTTTTETIAGNTTSVQHQGNIIGSLASERVSIGSTVVSHFVQSFDAAGRRSSLTRDASMAMLPNAQMAALSWGFTYRADGRLTSVTANSRTSQFDYSANGLLKTRTNAFRTHSIPEGTGRDAQGRIIYSKTTVAGKLGSALEETLNWTADSLQDDYTARRQIDPNTNSSANSNLWSDTRDYTYSTERRQLSSESWSVLPSPSTAPIQRQTTFQFDFGQKAGLGVRTLAQASAADTSRPSQTHQVGTGTSGLDFFSRVTDEISGSEDATLSAYGTALGAKTVSLSLAKLGGSSGTPYDGTQALEGMSFNSGLQGANAGTWSEVIWQPTGIYTLAAKATHPYTPPGGQPFSAQASVSYTIGSLHVLVATQYDNAGHVTQRNIGAGQRIQDLTWDALGRLTKVVQTEPGNGTGYEWTAIYDAFGRRLKTTWIPKVGNILQPPRTITQTSYYDPAIEFLEIGTQITRGTGPNSTTERWWKVHGPDLAGGYGGLQGMGGLESVIDETTSKQIGLIDDVYGHVLGFTQFDNGGNLTTEWNQSRFGGYGPLAGNWAPSVEDGVSYWRTLGWHGRQLDVTGCYSLGARYYESVSGRFLSPDPFGHDSSMGLYDYAGGDPINFVDPTGRFRQLTPSISEGIIRLAGENITTGAQQVNDWGIGQGNWFTQRINPRNKTRDLIDKFGDLPPEQLGQLEADRLNQRHAAYILASNGLTTDDIRHRIMLGGLGGGLEMSYDLATSVVGPESIASSGANAMIKILSTQVSRSVATSTIRGVQREVIEAGADRLDNIAAETPAMIPYYRVQGGAGTTKSRQLINVDNGTATFQQGTNLNLSVGNLEHARHFQTLRPGSQIYEVQVPKWFDDLVQDSAIPQNFYRTNPANQGGLAPKIVDPTTPGLSLELPPIWSQWLDELSLPGRVMK